MGRRDRVGKKARRRGGVRWSLWERYRAASRVVRGGIAVGALALVVLVCLVGLASLGAGPFGGGRHAPDPQASGHAQAAVSAAQPTPTPTFAQEAASVAQSSGASGSLSVSVKGTAITVRDEIGNQPDLTSTRTLVFGEAFAIQRDLWESQLHPSSVMVIITSHTLVGKPQSTPLGTCTMTASKEQAVLWEAETPLDAWAYVYDEATLTPALQVSHS